MNNKRRVISIAIIVCIAFTLTGGNYVTAEAVDEPRMYDVMSYGATGDGSTNDTEAIQDAIEAACENGGTVFFPEGNYLLEEPEGDPSELLFIDSTIRILGCGKKSKLIVASDVSSTVDVIKITPLPYLVADEGADEEAQLTMVIDGLTIEAESGTPANNALHIDFITDHLTYLSRFNLQNCYFGQLGGRAVYLSNNNQDGFFTSIIQNNYLEGGIFLRYSGDSVNIFNNRITGNNCGIELASVFGAFQVVIAYNNITSAGGAVRLTRGNQIKIIHNNIKQNTTYTGQQSEDACISIVGNSDDYAEYTLDSQYCTSTEIDNNSICIVNDYVSKHIYLDRADDTRITNNTFINDGSVTGPSIDITSRAYGTIIGPGNVQYAYGSSVPTNFVGDSGNYTTGIVKTASLQNSWVNYSSTFESASYWKDADNMIHLGGLIKNGTTSMGTLLFTLPIGYRPAKTEKFIVASNNGATPVYAEVNVNHDGTVLIIFGSNNFLSLSGISFRCGG